MLKLSKLLFFIGAVFFVVFLASHGEKYLPVADWNFDEEIFSEKVEEVQTWLEVEEPSKPKAISIYRIHGHLKEVRKKLGDHVANDLLRDGVLSISYADLENGGRIAFDSHWHLSIFEQPVSSELPDLSSKQQREQRIAFVKKFCARPDVPFNTENLRGFTRASEYPGVIEKAYFGKSPKGISYFALKHIPENEGPVENFPDFIGLPSFVWSTLAVCVLVVSLIGVFILFVVRLKKGDGIPLVPIFLVSFVCLFLVFGSFALIKWHYGDHWLQAVLMEATPYLCVPFLLAGLLGYGWSLDHRLKQGSTLSGFYAALSGRLPISQYAGQMGIGITLAIWAVGVYAGIVWIGSQFFEITFRPQPESIFREMLLSRHPVTSACLYFLFVAIAEESLYRVCGVFLIWKITKQKWLAVVIPAIVFAAAHLPFSFLGPEHPLLIKLLCCFAIAVLWGIAIFKLGFLAVLISHYLVDVGLALYFFQHVADEYYFQGVACFLGILSLPILFRIARLLFLMARPRKQDPEAVEIMADP